jgi:hypothetical protein
MLGVVLQLFPRQEVGWIGGFDRRLYYFESQLLVGIAFCELVEGSRVEFEATGAPDPLDSDAFRMAVRVRFAAGPTRRRSENLPPSVVGQRLFPSPVPPKTATDDFDSLLARTKSERLSLEGPRQFNDLHFLRTD